MTLMVLIYAFDARWRHEFRVGRDRGQTVVQAARTASELRRAFRRAR